MNAPGILIGWPNRPTAMAQLEETYRCWHLYKADDKEAMIAEAAPHVRGVVTSGESGVSAAMMDRLPNLEVIACFGVGVDGIDLEAARARGVVVSNTPGVLSEDVADMGILLMLAVMRRLLEADAYARSGAWRSGGPFELGRSPRGKTMGILGMGRIGQALARRAEVLGMSVVYHNRNRADVPYDYAATPVDLARRADVLVVCCPGGAATRNLVDAAVLEALGPEGWLINIARGSVVDEPALVRALTEKKIAGAGLDVFADEPNVPDALAAMKNVVVQSHQASATVETRDAMAQLVVDNLAAHFAGTPLLTRIA
ncbi:MAG: 2-hydroxyacid dehydrogenase [Geminicoccaceae bacterium]|nr:2-hydroxyacid dehydrogenase [Geminicoccaceae bacterium]